MKVGLISNTGLAKNRLLDMLTNIGIDIQYIAPPYDNEKIDGFDIIHFFPGYHLLKTSIQARLRRKRIVNHWIGTDVMSATLFHRRRMAALLTDRLFDIQLVVSHTLARELKWIGIDAYVLPNVPDISDDTPLNYPFNKKGVLVYLPEDRLDFHRRSTIIRVAAKFPSVNFHIVANNEETRKRRENLFFYGWLDDKEMESIWSKVNVLLRIPQHDGLPLMILEALARGKYVIWNYPFDYCYNVKNIQDIEQALRDVLEKTKPNYEARRFILKNYCPEVVARRYKKIYDFVLKRWR